MLSDNPFQPPDIEEPENEMPLTLIVLFILCGFHIALALAVILVPVFDGTVPGLILLAFVLVAFAGILMKQEWARVLWMIYCGCAFLLSFARLAWFDFPPLLLFALTIFVAHLPSVKRVTQRANSYNHSEFDEQDLLS